MLIRKTLLMAISIGSLIVSAHADNAACWGDDSRQDVTCTQLTEKLLLGLRGKTHQDIQKAMKVSGRDDGRSLHFLSNYARGEKTGSGDVNFLFENGRATTISALVDKSGKSGGIQFIWSAYNAPKLGQDIDSSTANFNRPAYCSDFSGKPQKCDSDSMDSQMIEIQTSTGASKVDMRKLLEAACNPGKGVAVSDPNGDCDRLRSLLQ